MALQRQVLSIDLTKGAEFRTSNKLVVPGKLTTAQDIIFRGNVVERRTGFTSLATTVLQGGAMTALLQGFPFGSEILAQGDRLYSYQAKNTQWVTRGTGFNSTVIKKTVAFKSNDTVTECDIATINGYTANVMHTQPTASTDNIIAFTVDEARQSSISGPLTLTNQTGATTPRVVAFSNIFLAFWVEGSQNLTVSKFDTAAPGSGWSAKSTVVAVGTSKKFDAIVTQGRCFIAYANAGNVGVISEVGTAGTVIAGPTSTTDTCDQGIGLLASVDSRLFVLTNNAGSGMSRTIFNLSLTVTSAVFAVDSNTTSSGTLTTSWSSLATSVDLYYSFVAASNTLIKFVNLTSSGTIGTLVVFLRGTTPASMPFLDSQSRRYFWCMPQWTGASANTVERCMFLVEDTNKAGTARIIAQAMQGTARWGSSNSNLAARVISDTSGNPAVILPEQFILGLTLGASGITNTSVVGVSRLTAFQQGSSPITKATLGGLQVVGGGVPMMYDGTLPVEVGFLQYPETIGLTQGAGGSLTQATTYQYAATYEWVDLKGNRYQSAPTPATSILLTGTNGTVTVAIPTLRHTLKLTPNRTNVHIVVWRTVSNGSTLFRLTPLTNSILNDVTVDQVTYVDTAADGTLSSNEILYTTRALSNINPPAAAFCVSHQNRLLLMGMEDPNLVQYSRKFVPGDGLNFSDMLNFQVNPWGGAITGGASMDEKLIIFEQTAVAYVAGDGPNDLGQQNSFLPPQLLSQDIGCVDGRTIVSTPFGVFFLSQKGFFLLTRGSQLEYIGAEVENVVNPFGAPQLVFTSATLLKNRNQIRWTTAAGTCLVYDYTDILVREEGEVPGAEKGKWFTFTNYAANDAFVDGNGVFTQVGADNLVCQDSDSANSDIRATTLGIQGVFETGPIKVNGVQGFQRVWRSLYAGQTQGGRHQPTVTITSNYQDGGATNPPVEVFSTPFNIPIGGGMFINGPLPTTEPLQWRHHNQNQKCEAIQLKVQFTPEIGQAPFRLENIGLEIGVEPKAWKLSQGSTI